MMENKVKGLLGLSRRAGKLSPGHDAAVSSIKKRKAFLAITCNDCSQRLKDEIKDECNFDGRNIPYRDAPFTMEELNVALGIRAGVIAIDDKNLAKELYKLTGGNE